LSRRDDNSGAPSGGIDAAGLRVEALAYRTDIVSDIALSVRPGRALGIVGESGCGKTTVALALLGLPRPGTGITSGSVTVADCDLLKLPEVELRRARGRLISFVPQNPSRALSPGMRIGRQLEEMLEVHTTLDADGRRRRIADALAACRLPQDAPFLHRYPHQLSGGQQQRVVIAMALVCRPDVIVMDEPTTGLDVITQAHLLQVLTDLRLHSKTTLVYISHDLGVVRNLVDRVAVMYGGRVIEEADVDDVFKEPLHPYTRRLLEAIPRVHGSRRRPRGMRGSAVEPWKRPPGCVFAPRCDFRIDDCDREMPRAEALDGRSVRCIRVTEVLRAATPTPTESLEPTDPRSADVNLLEVVELRAGYGAGRSLAAQGRTGPHIAVDGVSFEIQSGACLAVVGESGSGKTTVARCLAGLHAPSSGEIRFGGKLLAATARGRDPETRRLIQIVFQDPDSSLNPKMNVEQLVGRPLRLFFGLDRTARRAATLELLERVHLPASYARRFPRELSGGEKQRVALARALAAKPELLICDEVTSALDVVVQASILELLESLRRSLGMTMLFISHDLAVVRAISDKVVVMRQGAIREVGDAEQLFSHPTDGYTRELLRAVPDLRPHDYPPVKHSLAPIPESAS
jgi:peptide/nickel transport system ATP-binding protein